jgi:hypothetical protein
MPDMTCATDGELSLCDYAEGPHPDRDVCMQHAVARPSPGEPQVRFDPGEYTWLGSSSSYGNDAYLLRIPALKPLMMSDAPAAKSSLSVGPAKARPATTFRCF